jgi:hypothetical protein
MGNLAKIFSTGNQHPRENFRATGILGAANAEVIIDCDGCASVALDLRGTFSATFEVSGTVDGINWTLIPLLPVNQASRIYLSAITGSVVGAWEGALSGFWKVRVRCAAYTSGSATAALSASIASLGDTFRNLTSLLVTTTAAVATAATLTLAAPGAGLRQYLSFLRLERHAAATLTAAATPTIITTTNLPGSLAFSVPVEAAAQGSVYEKQFDFNAPLAASAQNTAATVVAPITTGVIWRLTAGYFVGP